MRRARPRRAPFFEVDGNMLLRKSRINLVVRGARRMKLRGSIGKALIRLGVAVMGCKIKRFKVEYDR